MAEKLEIYKCELCGNMVEVVHGGKGELVCCGQPMTLLKENTVDAAKEKHVPVIEKIDGGVKVDNIAEIARAGADAFVAGSAVFGAGSQTDPHRYDTVIAALRAELAAAGCLRGSA